MIKRIPTILILTLFLCNAWGQGWRMGEMEVRVMTDRASDIHMIRTLGLDYEPASADGAVARLYLVPDEFKLLQNSKLRYQVTIQDMNLHYAHFWDNPLVPPGYYTYEEIIAIADSLAANFPGICKKVIWGTSLGGRQLAALKISDNVNTDEPEAEIMFDGGIHGDEIGGSQNLIMFARDLCLAYGSNPDLTDLINNREIWLYLMVNPDGRVAMSRYNNNGVDCNRDNGYMWNAEGNSYGAFSQIETKALRNCIFDNQFVVYTNYHSGSEILSYPWSYRTNLTRDHQHIHQLAGVYAGSSGYTNLPYGQGYNIMYAINGSTKDFQYGSLGNIGWTMEISQLKQPPASQISYYYNANKPAMVEMIRRCGWGVSGSVTDSATGQPVRATVWVNNYFPVYTDPMVGDYHKYLVAGSYTIKVTANGYKSKTIMNITVPDQGNVVADVQLVPESNYYAYRVMSCRIPGNNFGDEGYTPGALGYPDSVPYSLGKNGWIILDMGDTIYNGPGADFKIIQAGTINKAFTVSGGNNPDGPFTTIGVGNGTTSFDLNTAPLSSARYLYIKDNGAGTAFGVGAGFNLDAVEMLSLPLLADYTASNNTPCTGGTVNFTDISTGNPTTWTWSFPGGIPSSSNLQNPSNIQYNVPGTYNVLLTISNGITSASITKTGFIKTMPVPVVNLGHDTAMCAWNTVLLDAGNPGGIYQWSNGATTQTITVDSTGVGFSSMEYWVIVTDTSGCSDRDTVRVTFENCTGVNEASTMQQVKVYPNPSSGNFMLDISGFKDGEWLLSSATGIIVKRSEIPGVHYKTTLDIREMHHGIYILKVQRKDAVTVKKIIIAPGTGN
ncbi:MAG: M14 family zinc carboxypeptidase [Bacteroidales bacterium]|nr:M14 family zinc carboxypeptidase [Bacteroidales bacterium]